MLALFIGLDKEAQGLSAKTSMDFPTREAKLLVKRYADTLNTSIAKLTHTLYRNAILGGIDKANLSEEAYKEAIEDLNRYFPEKKFLGDHPFLKDINLEFGRTGRVDYHEEGAYERIKELGGIIPVGAWREATPDDNPPNERAKYIDQLGNFFDKDFYWWDPLFSAWYNKIPMGAGNMFWKAICLEQVTIDDYHHPVFTAQIKDSRFKLIRDLSFDQFKNFIGIPAEYKNQYLDDPDEAQRKLVAENLKANTAEVILEKFADVEEKSDQEQALKELYDQEYTVSGFTKPIISLSQLQ